MDNSIKRLAVTATQGGGTPEQLWEAANFLQSCVELEEFHHGGCVGGDEELAFLVSRMLPHVQVHLHPGSTPEKYATYAYDISSWVVYDAKDNLERNQDMVNATDHLLGMPGEAEEILRSGTWATIRYARKAGRPHTLLYPDGTVHYLRGGLFCS